MNANTLLRVAQCVYIVGATVDIILQCAHGHYSTAAMRAAASVLVFLIPMGPGNDNYTLTMAEQHVTELVKDANDNVRAASDAYDERISRLLALRQVVYVCGVGASSTAFGCAVFMLSQHAWTSGLSATLIASWIASFLLQYRVTRFAALERREETIKRLFRARLVK